MKTVIYLALFFLYSPLFENSCQPFSFHQTTNHEQLEQIQNRYIEIKGFLYSLEDGTLLLASRPNLKSCCIGAASRTHEQLVLHGLENPPKTYQAITVRGIFKYDTIENRMELLQSQLVETTSYGLTAIFIILGGLIFSLLFLAFSKKLPSPDIS